MFLFLTFSYFVNRISIFYRKKIILYLTAVKVRRNRRQRLLFHFSAAELACDVLGTRKFDFVKAKLHLFCSSPRLFEIASNDFRS